MGNIDDEFQRMVEQELTDIDKDVPVTSSDDGEFQTFSSLYLVESLGHLSRTIAFLIEFMEVSMNHMARKDDTARPALTRRQVDALKIIFEHSATFNNSIMHPPEDDDDNGFV